MKLLLLSALFITCSAMGMERDEDCYTPKKEILSQRYKEYPDGSSKITKRYPDGGSSVSKLYTDGSSEKRSFYEDGSSKISIRNKSGASTVTTTNSNGQVKWLFISPEGLWQSDIKYPDGSSEITTRYPDGESFVTVEDRVGKTVTKINKDGKYVTLDIKLHDEIKKTPAPLQFDVNPKNIESFGNIPKNDNKKKKENIVLNAKLHAWIQKPTDEYDHNRSRQEIDEPIRAIDNNVRKSGEYYSRTICDSMEKYSQLRKPIEMEKKIVLLNSGGFNREQLLEQMDKVTEKIEILTDEYAREFIRMRGDIPEDEIENHLEEVKQIIKDEWFKNYSHDIHMSCVVE